MIFRLVRRELRHNFIFSLLFLSNFAIGLLGFISLDSFKRNLRESLADASRNLALGDVTVSARRVLDEEEQFRFDHSLPPNTPTSTFKTLYSMVSKGDKSLLVELKAIDANYPLYGYIELDSGMITQSSSKSVVTAPEIWVYPEILQQVGANIGDLVKIGDLEFKIASTVKDESAASFTGASYAPRAFVGSAWIEKAGLVRKGSTIWTTEAAKLSDIQAGTELAKTLRATLNDPALNIRSHNETRDDTTRVMNYVNDYLGLVAVVALFLAGIGGAYLFQGFLRKKRIDVAILLANGLPFSLAVGAYVALIATLAVVGSAAASLLCFGILPLLTELVAFFTPVRVTVTPSFSSMLIGTLIGTIGALLVCLPPIVRQRSLKVSDLFQEAQSDDSPEAQPAPWWTFLPAFGFFYLLSIWQAYSLKLGTVFYLAFIGAGITLFLTIRVLLALLQRITIMRPLPFKLASRYMTRGQQHVTNTFLALALGTMLLNLIPQLRSSLMTELERPKDISALPSLFLFDIQEDQVDGLKSLISSNTSAEFDFSPLIRARLTAINQQTFARDDKGELDASSRDQETNTRMRNRGLNLSYRAQLDESEQLVAGRSTNGTYDNNSEKPAEITVEQRYAERLGLKLGDTITVEIQEVPIDGLIVGIRKVKWNSFKPNFFIQFQPGALDDAPKTFLAAIPKALNISKIDLQTKISQQFGNVSVIDVDRLIGKILGFIEQLAGILSFMALFCLGTGLIVLFSIVQQQTSIRLWDSNLLKILGLKNQSVFATMQVEFLGLGLFACLFGSGISLSISYILSRYFFDAVWSPNFVVPIATSLILLALIALIVTIASLRIARAKPVLYLN